MLLNKSSLITDITSKIYTNLQRLINGNTVKHRLVNIVDSTFIRITDTASNFTINNPILAEGEVGIETDSLLTSPMFKFGNGITAWNSLPYASSGSSLGFTPENLANKGISNGYAPLNSSTKIDPTYLPSYVDDVIEAANFAALPVTGETGKIYITIDTNAQYRWTGTVYAQITISSAVWGSISGLLSNQTDLQNALNTLNALPQHRIPYGSGINTFTNSPALIFNGTNFIINANAITFTSNYVNGQLLLGANTATNSGVSVQNRNSNGWSGYVFGETDEKIAQFYRFGSTISGNFAGGSIPFAETATFSNGNNYNHPGHFGLSRLYSQHAITGTSVGFVSDANGFRIDQIQNLHTPNSFRFHIVGGTSYFQGFVRIEDGTQAAGRFFMCSDASGNGSWIAATTANIPDSATRRYVTDTEKSTWNALIGGSIFQTVWNANTNSPTLTSGVGTKGHYYIVTVEGGTALDGINDWKNGDWAIFDGESWRKVDNTDAIISFNGRLGAITPQSGDYTTAMVAATTDKNYVTNAQLTVLNNTSNINTGDETTATIAAKSIDDSNLFLDKTYSSSKIDSIRNEMYAINLILS